MLQRVHQELYQEADDLALRFPLSVTPASAADLVNKVQPHLTFPNRPTQAAIELKEFLRAAKEDWREKLKDLKKLRTRLANVLVIERLCEADELNLSHSLEEAVRYKIGLTHTPAVMQHKRNLSKFLAPQYSVQHLAERGFVAFKAHLYAWSQRNRERQYKPCLDSQTRQLATLPARYL